jgi:hypothetical protein
MGFFSFALLIELFFKNIKNILIFFLSILISGYFLIFYELGGDFFFEQGVLNRPSYVFKYIFQYTKILFRHRKNLEMIVFIKFFFFLCLPYIFFKIINNFLKFILFFIHKKTLNSMPIFSAFLLKLIDQNTNSEGKKKLQTNKKFQKKASFFNFFKKKSNSKSISLKEENYNKDKNQQSEFNLRK